VIAIELLKRKDLFIDGQWQHAEHYEELRSPYSQEMLCEIPSASEEEVDQAITRER
jgi:acyl-CoA reductase-like NAD-dependent aldehyde dehydrogenase